MNEEVLARNPEQYFPEIRIFPGQIPRTLDTPCRNGHRSHSANRLQTSSVSQVFGEDLGAIVQSLRFADSIRQVSSWIIFHISSIVTGNLLTLVYPNYFSCCYDLYLDGSLSCPVFLKIFSQIWFITYQVHGQPTMRGAIGYLNIFSLLLYLLDQGVFQTTHDFCFKFNSHVLDKKRRWKNPSTNLTYCKDSDSHIVNEMKKRTFK